MASNVEVWLRTIARVRDSDRPHEAHMNDVINERIDIDQKPKPEPVKRSWLGRLVPKKLRRNP